MIKTSPFPLFIFLFAFNMCLTAQKRFQYSHRQMGTQIGLVFYDENKAKADSVAQLVFNRIDELNSRLSNYIPDSEINILSNTPFKKVAVSNDLFCIIKQSANFSKETKGAFDVTLGPLIELWRKARDNRELPALNEIRTAMVKTGSENLELPSKNVVELTKTGMQLDVGGIGKGFAADEAIKILKNNGVNAALVDMGGDITVGDAPPDKDYWVLGFSYYDENGKEVFQKIKLKNRAVATSGDLYQYVVINNMRYSHIIDPRNGRALSNNIQVTTIAPNGTTADAYASALSVLGVEEGKRVVSKADGLEVFMVEDISDGYRQWNSSGFLNYMIED